MAWEEGKVTEGRKRGRLFRGEKWECMKK